MVLLAGPRSSMHYTLHTIVIIIVITIIIIIIVILVVIVIVIVIVTLIYDSLHDLLQLTRSLVSAQCNSTTFRQAHYMPTVRRQAQHV